MIVPRISRVFLVLHSGNLTQQDGKWTRNEDVFPIKNGDIPASYVSFREGIFLTQTTCRCFL